MTRENKIGLLVGLAFIIALGILLSDHMSSSDEPAPAPLQLAGSAVRSSLGDAGDGDPLASPLTSLTPPAVVRVPRAVAPSHPIPTAGELAARTRRAAAPLPPPVAAPADDSGPVQLVPALAASDAAVPPGENTSLTNAARRAGQAIVADHGSPAPVARHATARTVEAEAGDSLGTLAQRAYGSNTKATRAALAAANPSLQSDPDLIVAGRAYVVTAAAAPVAAGATVATARPTPTTPAKPATAVAWYTVQAGDTLWSIAADEVGTPRAVAAIRDLNRDVFRGDHVRPHMRLRLPKVKL